MKQKSLALLLCFVLLLSFSACTGKRSKGQENLPFSAKTVTLKQLPNAETEYQNEFYFFSNEKDLQKAQETLSKKFDLDFSSFNEESLSSALAVYDKAFFQTKTLLFVKRLHNTDTALSITGVDVKDKACVLHAEMPIGQPPTTVFRVYLITLDKAPYLKNNLDFSIDIHDVAPKEEDIYKTKLVMALGNQYKVVQDDAYAQKILEGLSKYPYHSANIDSDKMEADSSDIVFVGPQIYARYTKQYIDYGGKLYAPDENLQTKLVNLYVSLESPEKTLQFESGTDNLDEKTEQ